MQGEIVDRVKESIDSLLRVEEVELVDIVCRRGGGRLVLRLLVDKQGGISLGECSSLNRKLGESLDELNLIDRPYILEISSPGLDRPLMSISDFRRAMGEQVKVISDGEIEGKNTWIGEVVEIDSESVTLTSKGKRLEIPLSKIVRAKKEIIF